MLKKFKDLINRSIELEKKSTPSVRLYNICALALLTIVTGLLAVCWGLFLSSQPCATSFWLWSFFFVILLYCFGFVLGVKQRLRGGYLLSRICSVLLVLCLIAFIALVIYLRISLGYVPVFPFSH